MRPLPRTCPRCRRNCRWAAREEFEAAVATNEVLEQVGLPVGLHGRLAAPRLAHTTITSGCRTPRSCGYRCPTAPRLVLARRHTCPTILMVAVVTVTVPLPGHAPQAKCRGSVDELCNPVGLRNGQGPVTFPTTNDSYLSAAAETAPHCCSTWPLAPMRSPRPVDRR